MKLKFLKRIGSALLGVAMLGTIPAVLPENISTSIQAYAKDLSIEDMPQDYQTAADWIWNNRIVAEKSTERRNTIFDQIIAGKGTINYVVKWQSHKQLTLEQRQKMEKLVSDSINGWNSWLAGYENWPYEHIDVKIVGWAVIDESCILDRQPDEIIYTDTIPYNSQYDNVPDRENNPVPDKEPLAPSSLSRFDHFSDPNYEYPDGLDKRFDMYLWGTQGFPSIGGCGGDWGQRLSDDAYINMLDGSNIHVLEHEIGHGFGMTDFYGGEGESNGFPPGGFPGGENSLMMAGSATKITDFDGWMLRYMWTKIKDEEGRFDITQMPETDSISFTDTIIETNENHVIFQEHGTYNLTKDYYDDDSKNLLNYEYGDVIEITFAYLKSDNTIINVSFLNMIKNIRDDKISGDVNNDGVFNVADVVSLQKWLIGESSLENWQSADLNKDDVIDVFDLVLLKQMLIS